MNTAKLPMLIVGLLAAGLAGCSGSGSGSGAGPSTFSKSYGGEWNDEAGTVIETSDGGFMLFGSGAGHFVSRANDESIEGGDIWLQKLDADGNIERHSAIGFPEVATGGTFWRLIRSTSDGGFVLAGTEAILQPGGITTQDMVVAKLDASGNLLWRRTYDSGAWLNYDYGSSTAGANDEAEDIWPTPDGGFLLAGASRADLEDRHGIGFPCDDEELNELADDSRGVLPCGAGATVDGTFVQAVSAVVLRLDANGDVRWIQRLTDNAFDVDINGLYSPSERLSEREGTLGAVVRATADGGALLSRAVDEDSSLIHRLDAVGGRVWRTVLPHIPPPADLAQTDDPIDGIGNVFYDEQRDDGFVAIGGSQVVKLDGAGAVQWQTEVDPAEIASVEGVDIRFNAVTPYCNYRRPGRCFIAAAGAVKLSALQPERGVVAFLDQDGEDQGELRTAVTAVHVERFVQVAERGSNRLRLLGTSRRRLDGEQDYRLENVGTPALLELDLTAQPPAFINEQPAFIEQHYSGDANASDFQTLQLLKDHLGSSAPDYRAAITPTGGAVALTGKLDRLFLFDAQAHLQGQRLIGAAKSGEALEAAVEIRPGSFVLVASVRLLRLQDDEEAPAHGLYALRYDLEPNGGRIVWQRRLIERDTGERSVAVASGDGGVVIGTFARVGCSNDDPDREGCTVLETSRHGRVFKLDADGAVQWERGLGEGSPQDIHRMPDGDIAVLAVDCAGDPPCIAQLARFAADGQPELEGELEIDGGSFLPDIVPVAFTPTTDGGIVLVGRQGPRIVLASLNVAGEVLSARSLLLPADDAVNPGFSDLRIRQASDGGLVLVATAHSLFNRLDENADLLPYGQSNVLVMKVDRAGQPQWSRVYGAFENEGVNDLSFGSDGMILVAGYSDSLGERREAWLLKLAQDGLISESGCQALLGSIAPELIVTAPASVAFRSGSFTTAPQFFDELPPLAVADLPIRTVQDVVTARQCLGNAGRASNEPEVVRNRLTVVQVGSVNGVVTSEPVGISCGTGPNLCSADFAQDTRVRLRADPDRFVAWHDDCEADTGGTNLVCDILLTSDRTVQVEFGSPPRGQFTLSFEIRGPGVVLAGDINCREDTQPQGCSLPFSDGASVSIAAHPTRDWLGTGEDAAFVGWSGDPACSVLGNRLSGLITVDHDIHCVAEFREPNAHLLRLSVTGGGVVTGAPGFDCREGTANACQARYPSTTTVPLQALPDFGQVFAGWGGDCASFGTATTIEVVVSNNMTCTARFEPGTTAVTLIVSTLNGAPNRIVDSLVCTGSVCVPAGIHCFDGPGADCSEAYLPGTEVILRPNFAGVDWAGCDSVFRNVNGIADCRVRMDRTGRGATAIFPPF